ncbi:MAG TPA: UvrB/UvrC motif-containing protein [Verrucomicrobiae bacterium]
MKCCVCKEREATVHLTQIAGDKMQKLDLCEECAKTKGVNDPTGFSLADLLLGLGASQQMEQAAAATEGGELKCPHCGFTQADFKKAGRLGCPDCYRTFAEGLESLLKTMHKGTRHIGKVPEALRQSQDFKQRVALLQKKLAKAIEQEDFEQAAQLRDEIKQLGGRQPNVSAV